MYDIYIMYKFKQKDFVNTQTSTWSHWIVSYIPPSGIANVAIYVPSLITTDASTYYCVFAAGPSAGTTFNYYAYSTGFTLTMTTKSGGSRLKSPRNSKAFEYASILLITSKLLFV